MCHEFFGIVFETPSELMLMNPRVFLLASACLVLLFVLSAGKARWLRIMPPPLLVVMFGAVVSRERAPAAIAPRRCRA